LDGINEGMKEFRNEKNEVLSLLQPNPIEGELP
jgi:hypothetical protein